LCLRGKSMNQIISFFKKVFKIIFIGFAVIVILGVIIGVGGYHYYKTKVLPIELVKDNNYNPREQVKDLEGNITIYGWEIEPTEKPNTYFVSYTYSTSESEKDERRGWFWEMNIKERIVRIITGDEELEKAYSLIKVIPKKEEKEAIPKESNLEYERKSFEESLKNQEEARVRENLKEMILSKIAWKMFKKNMSSLEVISLVGEPSRKDEKGLSGTSWYYPREGKIVFSVDWNTSNLIVNYWDEPSWEIPNDWLMIVNKIEQAEKSQMSAEEIEKIEEEKKKLKEERILQQNTWRKLKKDLTIPELHKLLGSPSWEYMHDLHYPMGGVVFDYWNREKQELLVESWKEPDWPCFEVNNSEVKFIQYCE